jgi:hypothetical protein
MNRPAKGEPGVLWQTIVAGTRTCREVGRSVYKSPVIAFMRNCSRSQRCVAAKVIYRNIEKDRTASIWEVNLCLIDWSLLWPENSFLQF